MMKRLLRGLACALVLAASGSVAIAADWKIARLTGEAWILAEGADPVPATTGLVVPKGSTVSTRQNGRVMLVHGQDTVLVGPNSLVGVPYRPDRGVSTTLVQQVGEVELSVQKQGRPHFSVQTPFLAAVVKGTGFSVLVSEQDATVRVDHGLVAVQDLRSGERADVGAGQSATATRGGLSVSGTGAVPEVRAGRPQQPAVPALASSANPDAGNGKGNSGNGNGNGGGDGSNAGGNSGGGNSGNGNGNGGGDGSNAGGNGNGNNGNGGGDGSNAGGNGNGNSGNGNGGDGGDKGGNDGDNSGPGGGDNSGPGGGDSSGPGGDSDSSDGDSSDGDSSGPGSGGDNSGSGRTRRVR
jgi:hypothetical protein